MSQQFLLCLYGSSALIAGVVFYATLRAPGLSQVRLGMLIYLTGTAWWSIVDLVRWTVGSSSLVWVEAWTLPAGAFVVAGVRVATHGATRVGQRTSVPDIIGFAVHPLLALIVAAVPAFWSHVAVAASPETVTYGPIFWAHIAVTYALFFAGTIDLFRGRHTSQILNRRTAPILASFWTVPVAASVVTLVGGGLNGVDLMPPGFALTSLLVWKTLVPADVTFAVRIARSQVLEELADAVIVLGTKGHILDANAAALRLVGAEGAVARYVDRPLRQVWPGIADAAAHPGEYDLTLSDKEVILDVTVTPLAAANGAPSGNAVVLRDVTEAVLQRRELAHLRAELADLVVRDAVTGLHNRRYAEQTLPATLSRCVAKRVPMSIAVIDVDHFKAINDTHGHPIGDRVLRELARAMLDEVPSSMLARIGGEEFLVLLPGLSPEQAFSHTERLREACAQAAVSTREGAIHVTVSAGVATTVGSETTVEALMDAADAALYRAKREGRDRTCAVDGSATAPVYSV